MFEHALKAARYAVIGAISVGTLAIACTAHAAEKLVSCLIASHDMPTFKGNCLFTSEAGGSFTLRHASGKKPVYHDALDIRVVIVDTDIVEVFSQTKDGINSRWGSVKRSQQDKGCWVGSDFKICAWALAPGTKAANNVIVPNIVDGCKDNVNTIIRAAGLKPKRIDIHGPVDHDAAGIGCPYRQNPKAGSSVPKGSTVSYRIWYEAS